MQEVKNLETIQDIVEACLSTLQQTLLTRQVDPPPIGFSGSFQIANDSQFDVRVKQIMAGLSPRYSITHHALLAILDLCMSVAADPLAFPEIPSDHDFLEIERVEDVKAFEYYPIDDWLRPGVDFLAKAPRQPERQAVGWDTFAFALRFVSLHEQGHYLNGHLRLLPDGEYRELRMTHGSGSELLRAFELEADSFAFRNAALMGAYRWDEDPGTWGALRFCPNKVEWCMLSFAGAALVGLLLCHLDGKETDSGHPTPACRIFSLLRDVEYIRKKVTEVARVDEKIDQLWEPAIERSFGAVQAAATALGGTISQELHSLLDAHLNDGPHPAKEEYARLVRVLHDNDHALDQARAQIAEEIGGPII